MSETEQGSRERLVELLKKVRVAMFATRGPDGRFHSRPMATSDVEFDGSVYFLTDDRSARWPTLRSTLKRS